MKGKREATRCKHSRPWVAVDMGTLFALRGWIRRVLVVLGVCAQDLDDVVFDVMSSAYMTAAVGRYRPNPTMDSHHSLRRWLRGFCWRKASRYFEASWRRREIPHPEPLALVADDGLEPHGRLHARAMLRTFALLPLEQREILAASVGRSTIIAYAHAKGWPVNTTYNRLRLARRAFTRALRRRLW